VQACLLYLLCFVLILRTLPSLVVAVQQQSTMLPQTSKVLSLVTDVKEINIALRMVKNWPKHVGELLGLLNFFFFFSSCKPVACLIQCVTFKPYNYFNVLFLIK